MWAAVRLGCALKGTQRKAGGGRVGAGWSPRHLPRQPGLEAVQGLGPTCPTAPTEKRGPASAHLG